MEEFCCLRRGLRRRRFALLLRFLVKVAPWTTRTASPKTLSVYKTTKDAQDFYTEDFADWFGKGKQRELPGAGKQVVQDGLKAWRLDNDTFIRVTIDRERNVFVGTMAVAEIHVESCDGRWSREQSHAPCI